MDCAPSSDIALAPTRQGERTEQALERYCAGQIIRYAIAGWLVGCVWLNSATAEDSVMEMMDLHYRPAEEIQPLLQPLLEPGEALSGSGFDLIVKSRPARLTEIRRLIQQLDRRPRNLMISVMQSQHQSAEALNAEAALSISPNAIRMQGMTGDTRAVGQQGNLQQLRTLDGQAAHIEIGQLRPYESLTMYATGYGYPGVVSSTQWQAVSSGFAVIPRLQADNEIMLDIAPWSERFRYNGQIDSQSLHTSLRAHLGEWLEIGGISEQKTATEGYSGFNATTQTRASRILLKVDLVD